MGYVLCRNCSRKYKDAKPILQFVGNLHKFMFIRVPMDIIQVAVKIILMADGMFLKTRLGNGAFLAVPPRFIDPLS